MPSGDHAGEMIGSRERSAAWRIGPVGVGNVQFPGIAAGLHDIRNAGREHTAFAGEFLVDPVRNPVRRQSQVRGRDEIREPVKLQLLDGIEQSEAHVKATVGQSPHAADGKCVGAARFPLSKIGSDAVGDGLRAGIDNAEQAAARQVVAHDGRNVLTRRPLHGKRRDRDRELLPADAGDLDAQLRASRQRQESQRAAQGPAGDVRDDFLRFLHSDNCRRV